VQRIILAYDKYEKEKAENQAKRTTYRQGKGNLK
jgi:hypothetical protein